MHPLVEALVGERRHWAPAVRHAVAWAGALALAVSVASFAPEAAFVWALAGGGGGDHACVPARMAGRSGIDLLVPPAFAGLAVGASACFVRALAIGRRHDEY
ncbi:uncharacterized protein LOC120701561 [Panicum virgatum]|uniref:Uncharacterized protein n=1 Tax=Panicum virgatum TaxID=38727 RepID=A0A8T0V096_PANVG|nr:uncharacterized protein LOC120701561 [Panicum virgatum]KAG2630061.1 hypothetical protein PVAP13_3KG518300 [Panicum virgatum]